MNEIRVGGACGPPPPFVAPLVPRCALTTGATPRDVLSRRLRLGRPQNSAGRKRQLVIPRIRHHVRCRRATKWNHPASKSESPASKMRNRGLSKTGTAGHRPSKAESPTVEKGYGGPPTLESGIANCRKRVRPESDGRSHVSRAASTSRGVAPVVSAQRGTSGATNGGGGPQAPPTRLSFADCRSQAPPTRLSFADCRSQAPPTRLSFADCRSQALVYSVGS
jgi:hypothetical protein